MERSDTDKATSAIYEMYCAKHDIDQVIKTKGYDKVDRQKVDKYLFDKRAIDDDPLSGE